MDVKRPAFFILHHQNSDTLTSHLETCVTHTTRDIVAYYELSDGQGHFGKDYNPNIIIGDYTQLEITKPSDAIQYRLGSIICDARATARASTQQPPNASYPAGYSIETPEQKWSLNLDAGMWESIRR